MEGIDYPDSIKKIADTAISFNELTGEPKTNIAGELIALTDREYIKARNTLITFAGVYIKDEEEKAQSQGWSKIRSLNQAHQAFDPTIEPIAPNSIVVKHEYRTNEQGEESFWATHFYFVAEKKDKKLDLPMIFSLRIPTEDTTLKKSQLVHQILNSESEKERIQKTKSAFACVDEMIPNSRFEVEVWKEGKSLIAPKSTDKKVSHQERVQLGGRNPLPQPI